MFEYSLLLVIYLLLPIRANCYSCKKEEFNTLTCDYIPADVPSEIINVKIIDFMHILPINDSYFRSKNWGNIKYLELLDESGSRSTEETLFSAKCFSGLKTLETLKIKNRHIRHFDSDLFCDLQHVKTLDLGGCLRLRIKNVLQTISGTQKLPGLQKLILSMFGTYVTPIVFDRSFSRHLRSKRLTTLDMSSTDISMFNFSGITYDLNYLKVLNCSYTKIGDVSFTKSDSRSLQHMDLLDISYAIFPKSSLHIPVGKLVFSNLTIKWTEKYWNFVQFFAFRVLNVSGIAIAPNSFWAENCKANINEEIVLRTRTLIARHNRIKRVDVQVQCSRYKLTNFQNIDISYNEMEFLHPSIIDCLPNISKLDISGNQLFKMAVENTPLFEKMFQSSSKLKVINLSRNYLKFIPSRLFEHNLALQILDISHNALHQITLNIAHLSRLQTLDLRSNKFNIIADVTTDLFKSFVRNHSKTILLLEGNPFSCSTCEAKQSIRCLATLPAETLQHVTCTNEHGKKEKITEATVRMIEEICNRKIFILSICGSAFILCLIFCASVFFIYKIKLRMKKLSKIQCVKQRLVEGQGQFEFLALLSYSSGDEIFVSNHMIKELNTNLKTFFDVDRDLICTIDDYMRPGYRLFDEVIRCLERSVIMIVPLSNDYCNSEHCLTEFYQAYILNKPIFMVIIDDVNEDNMTPTMKMLYRHNAHLLKIENGACELKAAWINICSSIFKLILDKY